MPTPATRFGLLPHRLMERSNVESEDAALQEPLEAVASTRPPSPPADMITFRHKMYDRINAALHHHLRNFPNELSDTERAELKTFWKEEVKWMLSEPIQDHLVPQIDVCRMTGAVSLHTIHELLVEEQQKRRAVLPASTTGHVA